MKKALYLMPTMVAFVAVLFTSVPLPAVEPKVPLPKELVISVDPLDSVSLDEFLEKTLDLADKVTRSHRQRDVRPSDPLFTPVMRHLANVPPTRGDQFAKRVELLASKDSRVRYVALALIKRDWDIANRGSTTILKDSTALQARLTELLQDELWETADAAALQLSVLNRREWPRELTDYVVTQLKSEQAAVQVRAARLLRTAKKPPAQAEVLLLAALKSPTLQVERSEFAWALFHYGKIPAESVPTFIEAMRNSAAPPPATGGMCCASSSIVKGSQMDNNREEFYAILPLLGPDAAPVIPVLIESLGARDIETRRLAVVTLGKFGPRAKAALPHLKIMETKFVQERHSMIFGRIRFVTRIDTEVAKACEQISGASVISWQGFEPFMERLYRTLWIVWTFLFRESN